MKHTLPSTATLPKLKPEFKQRWLEALRSGKYKQAEGQLKTESGFCCLGVLTDIVKDDLGFDWVPDWSDDMTDEEEDLREAMVKDGHFDPVEGDLPESVFQLVFESWGHYDGDGGTPFGSLMERNDGARGTKRQTFSRIANIIENRC